MPDVLEEQLAARLRDLGDVTPAELEPPADLERGSRDVAREARAAPVRNRARDRRAGSWSWSRSGPSSTDAPAKSTDVGGAGA